MQGNNAYTVNLNSNTEATNEHSAVNQSSPTWVLTFVRFENRDTFRNSTVPPLNTNENDPLVVENDCVSVSTCMNKGTLTPSMEASLKETDINYLAAVAPGDFVFVNMLNWEEDARRVTINANNGDPINGPNDGFKGLFKVQRVSKNISVNEQDGTKNVFFRIEGYGFTEFNNIIYYNQNLLASGAQDNFTLFTRMFSFDWIQLINKKTGYYILNYLVQQLICSFIGRGVNLKDVDGISPFLPSPNTHFAIPHLVGNLLGIPNAKAAKDVYNYIFGIQSYSANLDQSMAQGLNPAFRGQSQFDGAGFHFTTADLDGQTEFAPEYWNATKAWAIINQYTNTPLNEIYTCYRLNTDNKVYPTVIFRQAPFTTQDFETRFNIKTPVTKFLTVPRWSVDSSLVYSFDMGRDEVARVNFYQYFSRGSSADKQGVGTTQEISAGNYAFDPKDVQRSGLRPSIIYNLFDPGNEVAVKTVIWSKIMADATFGGHLKLNGTLEMVGVIEPICIGDNLEFEGIVFHIESVIHNCFIDSGSGIKRFKTTLKLSSGVSLDSTNSVTYYGQMTNTNAYQDRTDDYNNLNLGQILPGVSESQDTLSRAPNVDIPNLNSQTNSPFPQPTKPKGQK
jgi:hypothetical protein